MSNEFITVEELAKICKVNEETVRRWCKKGKIKAKRIDRRWFINRDVLNIDDKKIN